MAENNTRYPEGHFVGKWMAIGIVIFSVFGVPISIVSGNPGLIAIGPAVGVAFGLAIGSSIESKYKKEGKIRPLTEDEKKQRKMLLIAGIALFLLGLAIFLLRLFS
ncbi:MAG: hypothetical protein PHD13_01815 [Methanocellales archaeon]|nr:hypothetical protein [Methanocellales archaeon]MDD3291015.1 hypothetical protein [Methanocellales archaeon]MDD5234900.1 hypothetical protein [Methanocellales archaeon]MDD5484730.1 hypothetical protein [Methanocellales archaeon]